MGIEFRSGYNLGPIADRLENARLERGFHAFEYEYLAPVVASATKFHPQPTRLGTEYILHRAIDAARQSGRISVEAIRKNLESEFAKYRRMRKKPYDVLTHISSTAPNSGSAQLSNSTVRFGARLSAAEAAEVGKLSMEPTFRTPSSAATLVRSRVYARLPGEAVDIALDDLDVLRGLWILWASRGSVRASFGLQRRPLAPVVIGPTHTVHSPNGRLALETYWWRNGFAEPAPGEFAKKWPAVKRHTAWARRRISRIAIRPWLEAGLQRYATALDVTDWETTFAKLWAVLEYLTRTGNASYDATVRRALFLNSVDQGFHRQVLRHLRDYRNSVIHHDFWSRNSEQLVCHLKFYVDHLLVFLIRRGHYFENVDAVGQFLDLPRSRRLLLRGAEWLR